MLSALNQGSLIHIIDKTNNIKYKVGEIVNKTEPKTEYCTSPVGNMQTYIDIVVRVDGENLSFNHIPTSVSTVNYNNGNVTLSETQEGLIPTVESILHNSKSIVDNIDYYKNSINECEDILIKLNPTFAKEKERDGRINELESKVGNIDTKLDKIFELLNK